jgi:nucleoside diphosphate kinase
LEGPQGLVASVRKLIGVTNPLLAEPGTIRGDLGIEVGRQMNINAPCFFFCLPFMMCIATFITSKQSYITLVDYIYRNVVHGSDSPDNGVREIGKLYVIYILSSQNFDIYGNSWRAFD